MNTERLEKIALLFQAALDLPLEKRSTFVATQCRDDRDLESEIVSLLEAHDHVGTFIEDSASSLVASLLQNARMPDRIGSFKIERPLGKGGMGEVYLATDKIGRKVALKLLPSQMQQNEQHVTRFLQEAQTLVALNHPNIVTVYDIGETDGTYYIASELIEGENLREHLSKHKPSLNGMLELSIQVGTALTAAHQKGIIHRDIKPENVMVRSDGYVKVLDFGIAKLTEGFTQAVNANAPTRMKLETAEGLVIGTASHMSPEQARGAKVDERTDIWSCGVLLYEALTDHQPFAGPTAAEIIARILEREPAPLSDYLTDVPEELQRIITKALAKNRDDRYQTAQEFVADLKSLKQDLEFADKLRQSAANSPTGAFQSEFNRINSATSGTQSPVTVASGVVSGLRKHLLLFAVVLILGSGITAYLLLTRSSKSQRIQSLAVLPFVNESGNPDVDYLSDGLSDSLINNLSRLPQLSVKARSAVFRYKNKEIDPQQVASELSVQAVVNGRVVEHGDNLTLYLSLIDGRTGNQIWGDQYDRKMIDLVALQRQITGDVSQKLRAQIAPADERKLTRNYTANSEAYQLYLKGRYHTLKLTLSEVQTAISYFQQAIALDPSFALAYVGLADAYRSSLAGDMPPKEVLPKAKEAVQKALEIDESLAEAHAQLGFVIFWYDWDWNAAEAEYKRALELDPNDADTHLFYAHLLSNLGRHSEALEQAKRARELDPFNLRTNALEAQFLIHAGRVDEALGRLQKTFEMAPDFYFAHLFAASAYIEKGMFAEAISEAQKARQLSGPSNSHPVGFLGYALAKAGRQQEARAVLDELLRASREHYVAAYNIALIYNGLGEREKTFEALERAYEQRDQRMVFLKVEPKWNNLRSDPHFQGLMHRVGLN